MSHPKAAVIAVGNELLNGSIADTNTSEIARALQEVGIELLFSMAVRDEKSEIVNAVNLATERASLTVVCGGIGPTKDDLTREAVAEALGVTLEFRPEAWEAIKARLKARGVAEREDHKKQAMIPKGATPLKNPVGSALGAMVKKENRILVMLPGVPKELRAMLGEVVAMLPEEWKNPPQSVIRLRSFGLPESEIDRLLEPLWNNPHLSLGLRVLSPRHTEIRIAGDSHATLQAKETASRLLGDHLYSTSGEELEEVLGRLLRQQGKSIATAESCTGGMISHTITNVPGSSDYMLEALVTYSNEAKEQLLGVSHKTLLDHGAVSRETAEEMVKGLRRVSGADCCAAVTGIAGPGGGTPQKPVGLVFAGFYVDNKCWVREYRFSGSRLEIKQLTTMSVLNEIRLKLEKNP